jgi:drug/metabolite transporter (DMT)-like permease
MSAGAVLGSSFVFYALTPENSGMWPVLAARVVAILCVAGVLVMLRTGLRGGTSQEHRLAVGAGLADVTATVSLVAGVRAELAVLVAAVTALAPGFTVMWSWALLKERVGRIQLVGVALALVGLVTIAAG